MGSNTFYGAGLLLGRDAPCRKKHVPRAREDSYRKQYRAIVRGFFWEVTRLAERNTCQERGGIPKESGVFCVCRIPRKDGSAPRGRELYAGRARPPVRA